MKSNWNCLILKLILLMLTTADVTGGLTKVKAQTMTVGYDANAPLGNFGNPTNVNSTVAYTISVTADSTYASFKLVARPDLGGMFSLDFVNLYLSTTVATGSGGSNLGFEIGNANAFVPGVPGSYSTANDGFIINHDAILGTWNIEIPWTYFETDPDGIGFEKIDVASHNILRLNGSQSFGYTYIGGQDSFGNFRLGEITPVSAPEPGSATLLLLGATAALWLYRRSF